MGCNVLGVPAPDSFAEAPGWRTVTPPSPSPRAALAAVAALFFVNGATLASWAPRLPEIRDHLGVSEGKLGVTLVGVGLGGLAVSLASGAVVDRFGSRRVCLVTSLVLSALLPLIGLAGTPVVLFGLLVLIGSFDGLTDVAMNQQALIVQDELRRRGDAPHVMTRLHGMWSVGTLTAGIVSARAAAAGLSLRVHLALASAVFLVTLAVVGRWLVADPPRRAVPVPDTTARHARRLPRPLLVRLFAIGIVVALTESPPNDWASLMWSDHYHLPDGRAALGYVAIVAGMVAGRFTGDLLVGRCGADRVRRGGAVVAAVAIVAATLAPVPGLSAVGMILAGFGIAQLFPLMFVAASEATGGRPSGMAAFSSGARCGFLVAPPLIGGLAELSSVATAVLVVSATAAAISAAVRPAPKLTE